LNEKTTKEQTELFIFNLLDVILKNDKVNNIFSIIVTTIKKTFSFSGRASRKEFVIFNLFYFITIFIVYSTEEIYAISNDITLIVFLTLFYLCVLIFTIPPLF